MFDNPREHPSLPQYDTPGEQEKRRQQLLSAQSCYQWGELGTLPGVPLATTVPRADRPTVAWMLEAAEAALPIVENQLAVKLRELSGSGAELAQGICQQHLEQLRKTVETIRTQSEASEKSALDVAAPVFETILSLHRIRLDEELDALKRVVEENYTSATSQAGLESYRRLFATLPLPDIANTFMSNDCFARMRVAGPNSLLIQGITSLPSKFPLSEAQYRQVMGAGDDLTSALAEGRLYLLDYEELQSLQPGTTDGRQKYVFAPVALFAVPKGGTSLTPVAIQCGQDPAAHPMFLRADAPGDAHWWAWQMARTVVQVAEGNYHELFVHLARTHLVVEAFAVATHRQLASAHPVNVLLMPHFEGTLFINYEAATSLIAEGGPIDEIFGGAITSTQEIASSDRLEFDFYAHMLPNDLQRRHVADVGKLPDYPYRDDALLVWKAIQDWVDSYIRVYYRTEDDVLNDSELSAWVRALQTDGKIAGFRDITSRAQLVEVLTMVIFTASAQHAAVNFPQRPDMSYAPAITGAGWAPAPATEEGGNEQDWLALLPPLPQAQQQLNVLWLLGSVYYRPLGDYRANDWPYLPWFRDEQIIKAGGPLEQFKAALKVVEAQIDRRNLERAVPYTFLKPSLIPTSINI